MSTPGHTRGHSRNVSDVRRVAMVRRSTKGPLDMLADDPPLPPAPVESTSIAPVPAIQSHLPPSPALVNHLLSSSTTSSSLLPPSSTTQPLRDRSPSPNLARAPLDLTPLLRPSIYHSIPTSTIPPPLLSPQPSPSTPLATLLRNGHFRPAAEKAASDLCAPTTSPNDVQRILHLFHTRLACLVLLSHVSLAATEARALLDVLARETVGSAPGSRAGSLERGSRDRRVNPVSFVPWDLRLLLERLKVVGSGDARRGVMALYALGAECRAQAAGAARMGDAEGRELWRGRLKELGVGVVGLLIEMGEVEAAVRQLRQLDNEDGDARDGDALTRKALLYLRLGDLEAAEACCALASFSSPSSSTSPSSTPSTAQGTTAEILKSLILIAEGHHTDAVTAFKDLHARYPANELITHNLAIALVYAGDAVAAARLLEGLVDGGDGSAMDSAMVDTEKIYSIEENIATGENSATTRETSTTTGEKIGTEAAEKRRHTVFPALLFNLATIYELRTERARDAKLGLVDRVAAAAAAAALTAGAGAAAGNEDETHRSAGMVFERQAVDFKL